MKLTYLHLGRYESADQIAAARWFGQQPFVSADRIGIWGWSYGGDKRHHTPFFGGGVFKDAPAAPPPPAVRAYDQLDTHALITARSESNHHLDQRCNLPCSDNT